MTKITPPNEPAHHIAVFQETTIRRVWHNEEWWFALSDVIVVLTDSADPRQYIKKMRTQIAAHALALGLSLVTHNMRHFGRVPGLKLEDWMT